MRILRATLAVTALLTVCGSAAWAELSCSQNPISTTILRAESVTELLPDISFTCIGIPSEGSASYNILVSINAPITSKTDGALNTEATLSWTGSITGSAVGVLSGATALNFSNIAFAPTVADGFTLKLSGIRVNASTLAQGVVFGNGIAVQVFAQPLGGGGPLFGASGLLVNLSNVAYVAPSLAVLARVSGDNGVLAAGTVSLSQCEVRTWSADTPGTPAFYVTLQETFSNGFRTMAQEDVNPAIPTNGTRVLIAFQNIPNNVQLYVPNIYSQGSVPTTAVLIKGANADGSGGVQVSAAGYTQVTGATAN